MSEKQEEKKMTCQIIKTNQILTYPEIIAEILIKRGILRKLPDGYIEDSEKLKTTVKDANNRITELEKQVKDLILDKTELEKQVKDLKKANK
jgi:hypothetical protein